MSTVSSVPQLESVTIGFVTLADLHDQLGGIPL
jgi:hypothetical protein